MTKRILFLITILTCWRAPAAGYDVEALTMLGHGKPLIEKFLAETGRTYGVDLTPAPDSFRARITFAQFVNWPALPLTMGTRYDTTCRPIDVVIPARNQKARFYVRRTYRAGPFPLVHRYREPGFELVRGCSALNLSLPPLMEFHPHQKRVLTNDEVVTATREIVGRTRPDATEFRFEPPSVRDHSDTAELFGPGPGELFDCRNVSFAVPGVAERVRVGVFVLRDRDRPFSKLPADRQTTLLDPISVHPFTFALVRSCVGSALRYSAVIPSDRTPSAAL